MIFKNIFESLRLFFNKPKIYNILKQNMKRFTSPVVM
jgi:hypothetical protein